MEIDKAIKDTIDAIIKQPVVILVSALITVVLSGLTIGLLWPFLYMGMGRIFLKVRSNEEVSLDNLNDSLFFYKKELMPLILQGLIIFFTALLGMLLLVPGFFVLTVWIYAPFFLAYSDKGLSESLASSYRVVMKNGLVVHFVIMLCITLINLVGFKLMLVGLLVTVPLSAGFLTYLFEKLKDKI